jgi:hypothetical protein
VWQNILAKRNECCTRSNDHNGHVLADGRSLKTSARIAAGSCSPAAAENEEKESYEVEGVINVTYPVLDEHRFAVAALTVPYIRRIDDSTTTAIVRQTLKRASSQLSLEVGGISRERPKSK